MTTKTLSEHQLQERLEEFVEREIIANITQLFSNLLSKQEYLYDDILPLLQGSPTWGEWLCQNCKHEWDDEPETIDCPKCLKTLPNRDANFDPTEYGSIFQQWIVSSWLANELKIRGECVEIDFHGLSIWGRGSFGQCY